MNPVLDHPELCRQIAPMTVETYHILGEMDLVAKKSELIEGYVLPKMPKSPIHTFIVSELAFLLKSCLPSSGWLLRKEDPLTLEFSEPEPDLAVVIGQRHDFARSHPITAELVLEVAYSSMSRDLVKANIYARAGIKEYWLINVDEKWIDLYGGPSQNSYETRQRFSIGETVHSIVIKELSVELSTLFI